MRVVTAADDRVRDGDHARHAGPVALVGSGEFTTAAEDVDRALLQGREQKVVFLPTAAAPEGEERLAYWVDLGRTHYRRLGVPATPLLVLDRDDADRSELAEQVAGAGLVYLSGGDPTYLAQTLAGSRVGDAILAAWRGGAALAGCSAGAIALTDSVPDIRRGRPTVPGLGVVRSLMVIPHFDRIERWAPGVVARAVEAIPDGVHLVGVDEDTAIVGGPAEWRVMGRLAAWVLRRGADPERYGDGQALRLS